MISKIADEIRLHGSWEAAQAFNEEQARKWMHTERPKNLIPKSRQAPPPPPRPAIPVQSFHTWVADRYRAVNRAIEECRGTAVLDPIWKQEREWLEELLHDAIIDYKNGNRENINTCRNCRRSTAPGAGQQGE